MLLERVESRTDVLRAAEGPGAYFQPEYARSCLSLGYLWIAEIGHDCQATQARHNLAQEFEALTDKVGCLDREASNVAARSRQTVNESDWQPGPSPTRTRWGLSTLPVSQRRYSAAHG